MPAADVGGTTTNAVITSGRSVVVSATETAATDATLSKWLSIRILEMINSKLCRDDEIVISGQL